MITTPAAPVTFSMFLDFLFDASPLGVCVSEGSVHFHPSPDDGAAGPAPLLCQTALSVTEITVEVEPAAGASAVGPNQPAPLNVARSVAALLAPAPPDDGTAMHNIAEDAAQCCVAGRAEQCPTVSVSIHRKTRLAPERFTFWRRFRYGRWLGSVA